MDDLGRVVAAERNALAAITLAKTLSERLTVVEGQCFQTKQQNVIFQEQINALQVRLATMRGNGATEV